VKFLNNILKTDNDKATILIRLIIGYIFIMEGIQKFVYSEYLGVGRFIKIGIPYPEVMAPIVGGCEIFFGSFILFGFLVRVSAIPQIIIILTALASTKLSILIDKGLLTFSHEARNDLLMLFGLLFLLIKGAGSFSIDKRLLKNRKGAHEVA
jgi:putative oxidoreductase